MSLNDDELLGLMDAYADAHPEAEPAQNFADLFPREELVQMLQKADGRTIDVNVVYGDEKQDYRPISASYRYV